MLERVQIGISIFPESFFARLAHLAFVAMNRFGDIKKPGVKGSSGTDQIVVLIKVAIDGQSLLQVGIRISVASLQAGLRGQGLFDPGLFRTLGFQKRRCLQAFQSTEISFSSILDTEQIVLSSPLALGTPLRKGTEQHFHAANILQRHRVANIPKKLQVSRRILPFRATGVAADKGQVPLFQAPLAGL